MKSLIVLSHLSSVGNDLDSETTDRAKLAVELFKCEKYDNLITSGWANNSQFNVPISILLKSYIVDNFDIARSSIVSLPYSRDTVGDAFFCRLLVQNIDLTSMSVITSDYHVQRTSLIFKKFFKNICDVKVVGLKTGLCRDPNIICNEKRSTQAFEKTFENTNFNDMSSLYNTLISLHPFYNGEIHQKLSYFSLIPDN